MGEPCYEQSKQKIAKLAFLSQILIENLDFFKALGFFSKRFGFFQSERTWLWQNIV